MNAAGKKSLRSTVSVRSCLSDQRAELIRNKGLEKINLDDLVEEMLPRGRALVPSKVKEDLLGEIKGTLEKDEDYRRLTGYQ